MPGEKWGTSKQHTEDCARTMPTIPDLLVVVGLGEMSPTCHCRYTNMDLLDLAGSLFLVGLAYYVARDWFSRIDAADVVSGKRVVITGASRGIGEQLAYYYARCGASLLLAARDESRLQRVMETCKHIGRSSATFHYISVDFKDSSSAEKTIQFAKDKLGGLDILTLNHAWIPPIEPWGTGSNTVELLDDVMNTNFRSYVQLTAHALPLLEKSEGYLCVVNSAVGKAAVPNMANYVASKFAQDGFFSSLRQELRLQGKKISITLAVLGIIGTDTGKEVTSHTLQFPLPLPDPMTTASAILEGTMTRSREIHFPWYQGVTAVIMLNGILPNLMDLAIRFFYR